MKKANDYKYCLTETQIQSAISRVRGGKKKICAFGAGKIGTGIGFEYIKKLGLCIDCYCDNNKDIWGTIVHEGIRCISIKEFQNRKEEFVCFVLVGMLDIEEICKQLFKLGIREMIPFDNRKMVEILRNDFYPFDIYRNKNYLKENLGDNKWKMMRRSDERIAVYTCITGDFDQIKEPEIEIQNCDYFLISDKILEDLKVFQCLDINLFLPKGIDDNRKKNRYCKIHPHKIFPKYQYSIYVDGNIQILGDITGYVDKIGVSGIATPAHPQTDSIYEEGINCTYYRLDNPEIIMRQITGYWEEGMPYDFGHRECGVLVREHNDENCIKIMEDWWQEIKTKSYRDQLSFTYAVWKNGFQLSDVGLLGDNCREFDELRVYKHSIRS